MTWAVVKAGRKKQMCREEQKLAEEQDKEEEEVFSGIGLGVGGGGSGFGGGREEVGLGKSGRGRGGEKYERAGCGEESSLQAIAWVEVN